MHFRLSAAVNIRLLVDYERCIFQGKDRILVNKEVSMTYNGNTVLEIL